MAHDADLRPAPGCGAVQGGGQFDGADRMRRISPCSNAFGLVSLDLADHMPVRPPAMNTVGTGGYQLIELGDLGLWFPAPGLAEGATSQPPQNRYVAGRKELGDRQQLISPTGREAASAALARRARIAASPMVNCATRSLSRIMVRSFHPNQRSQPTCRRTRR